MLLPKVRDRGFRLFVIIAPLLIVIYSNGVLENFSQKKLFTTCVSLCSLLLITEGSRWLIYRSRNWFTGSRRMIFCIIAGLAWTAFCLAMSSLVRHYISTGKWDTSLFLDSNIIINDRKIEIGLWGYALLNAVLVYPVLLAGYEIVYHYAQLRHAAEQKEVLEKEKLKAELQQLKGIVNPHFLFNNLNSLSSLIAENPDQAQDFLDELTRVFRYLLRNNDTDLTTLHQELQFINSYCHLLETRYGAAIKIDINIDPSYHQLLIPPMTLQLLIENAVKHNRLQKENPLRIELLGTPGNKLLVRNNLLLRESQVDSTGIGLQNINARYRMLGTPGLHIEKTDDRFTVVITLIDQATAISEN